MKKIEGYSYYQVSEDGKIYSTARSHLRELKTRVDSSRYKRVMLYDGSGGYKTFLVHRLVAMAYIPNPNNLPCINHKDGNKLNNHISNLEWCTHSQNMSHAFDTKLRPSNDGQGNPKSILTEKQVLKIYQELLDGRRSIDVAKEFSVNKATIDSIKIRKNWDYLTKDLPDIPRVRRNYQKLSDSTVRWICHQLEEGVSAPEIVKMSTNQNITVDRVWDIKRRRCYKSISEDFNF